MRSRSPSKSLESRLNAGTTLVVDRYIFSGVSYSAAKVRTFCILFLLIFYTRALI